MRARRPPRPCGSLAGCLAYLEKIWLTPHDHSIGKSEPVGNNRYSVTVLNRHGQTILTAAIEYAGPDDWDIGGAVWQIQWLTRKDLRGAASRTEDGDPQLLSK